MHTLRSCSVAIFTIFLAGACSNLISAADELVVETTEAAAADPDFSLQGEYVADNLGVQVMALGGGEFRIVKYMGGLPGAGWNGEEAPVIEDEASAVRELLEAQALNKIERKSPTLGASPPSDAVILFDGSQRSLDEKWQEGVRMTPDGLLMQGATTRETFTDFSLHLEFRLPYMPQARGQGRGNSGVYYQSRYETQVLDSFGLEGKNDECGGLYTIRDPDVNMCLPPLAWQTYDCDFTAACWDANGQKTANARITVKLNGVVIHQDAEFTSSTRAAPLGEGPEPGPLYIQDHGNPVRFRNIWLVPRNAELEALRPIIPAFERFFAGRQGPAAEAGGELLISELGCTNCHASHASTSQHTRHTGPVFEKLGERIYGNWIAKFIESPHTLKPGTTMPAILSLLPEEQRRHEVQAITSYLVGRASPPERGGDRAAGQRGAKLYAELGCVACHSPRNAEAPTVDRSSTIPLPDLRAKYTTVSLAQFLREPHRVRTSGRMPSFNLDDRDARDIACFLIGDPKSLGQPNLEFTAYKGSWSELPKFETLTPAKNGQSRGFDLSVAGDENNFAIRFDGYWKIEKTGQYRFFLGPDDGSRLWIDGTEVVNNDGTHPHQDNIGRAQLEAGVHHVQVDYFQGGGEWTLTVDFDGSGFLRQTLETFLHPTREEAESPRPPEPVAGEEEPAFVFDETLQEEGRELFTTRGCAACHRVEEQGQVVASKLAARPLAELDPTRGCLAPPSDQKSSTAPTFPQYDLNPVQRQAIAASLKAKDDAKPADLIETTLATYNCYACHRRDGVGGPARDRDPLFITTIHEMGDEGRVPPPLDGVGDKLQPGWLKHVLQEGAKDRPYMKTRMPRFGSLPADDLAKAFAAADQKDSGTEPPKLDEPAYRVIATGRKLAGNTGLACVKCHTFGKYPASGIQAIDLQTLAKRVREDWFYRYLVNPQKYRPGTRMPTAFVDGMSAVKDICEGHPDQQMAALWTYLSEGAEAGIPDGVLGETIELTPTDTPIIYRNFLAELSPRGIAVGYPEKAHLAWDAERMCLALVWHGRFIDAGMHWVGRGNGNQSPLGDHVMRIDESVPVAALTSRDTPWPKLSPRSSGYVFRGYKLNEKEQPTFRYDMLKPGEDFTEEAAPAAAVLLKIEDTPVPAPELGASGEPGFRRTLVLNAQGDLESLYLRAASATSIEPSPEDSRLFIVNGSWRIRLAQPQAGEPFVRDSEGKKELLLPISFVGGRAEIIEELSW